MIKLCENMVVKGYGKKMYFPIIYEIIGNRVKFLYETKCGRFEPKPIKIKRYIPINKDTLIAFGLFQSEGSKKNSLSFQFTNSNKDLVKFIMNYFEKTWGIDHRLWSCQVTCWKNYKTEDWKESVKNYWKNELNIKENKIKVIKGTSYRLSDNAKEFGVFSLRLDRKIFWALTMNFLEIIKKLSENDETYAGYYIKGLLAGDGSISIDSNGSIAYVSIAFNPNSNEHEHYMKILKKLDINGNILNKNSRSLRINGWRNYYKLLTITENEPFFMLKEKNRIFVKGFLKNQYVIPLKRLNNFLLSKISTQSYAKEFGVCERSAMDSLKRLKKLGFLIDKKEGNRKVYLITPEGSQFLKLINNLSELK